MKEPKKKKNLKPSTLHLLLMYHILVFDMAKPALSIQFNIRVFVNCKSMYWMCDKENLYEMRPVDACGSLEEISHYFLTLIAIKSCNCKWLAFLWHCPKNKSTTHAIKWETIWNVRIPIYGQFFAQQPNFVVVFHTNLNWNSHQSSTHTNKNTHANDASVKWSEM